MDIKKRINELTEKLLQWEYAYYALDKPVVSDTEYDEALRHLKELESQYPEYKHFNSPTMRVGGVVLDKFVKVKHDFSMLSLDNAFNEGDILNFNQNINETTGINQNAYVVEPKIDGLSVSLIYQNQKLVRALTRGDGITGEDVTENVKTIRSIPLQIETDFPLVTVRGEVFISNADFEKINSTLPEDKRFANPRNLAAGSLRNLDSKIAAKRRLNAYLYYIPNAKELGFKDHWSVIEQLRKWKFNVAKDISLVTNIQDAWKKLMWFEQNRHELSYAIDGAVLKLNDINAYEKLGYTAKFPKWAIAYKFPAIKVVTKLFGISTTVGRTGRINYIAHLKPVEINGTIVRNATLHNYDYIEEKDIMINDYVEIYKAGEIIPKVKGVVLDQRDIHQVQKFEKQVICPACQTQLVTIEGQVDQYCPNSNCSSRILQGIIHFCTRGAMNIEGVSEKLVEKLFTHRFINNIADLYALKDCRDQIILLDLKIKEKLINKIIESIERSKQCNLHNLIYALGIDEIGAVSAKTIARHFGNMEALQKATVEDLIQLEDVGTKMAQSITEWFAKKENIELIDALKKAGVNMTEIIDATLLQNNSPYFQKTFLITGSFTIKRDEIKNILTQRYDAKFRSQVTKNIDYVIAGSNATASKIEEAKKIGIQIITSEFWNL